MGSTFVDLSIVLEISMAFVYNSFLGLFGIFNSISCGSEASSEDDGPIIHELSDGEFVVQSTEIIGDSNELSSFTHYDADGNQLGDTVYAYDIIDPNFIRQITVDEDGGMTFELSGIEFESGRSLGTRYYGESLTTDSYGAQWETKITEFSANISGVSDVYFEHSHDVSDTHSVIIRDHYDYTLGNPIFSHNSSVYLQVEGRDPIQLQRFSGYEGEGGGIDSSDSGWYFGVTTVGEDGFLLSSTNYYFDHDDLNARTSSTFLDFYSDDGELKNRVDVNEMVREGYDSNFGDENPMGDYRAYFDSQVEAWEERGGYHDEDPESKYTGSRDPYLESMDMATSEDGTVYVSSYQRVGWDADLNPQYTVMLAEFDANGEEVGDPVFMIESELTYDDIQLEPTSVFVGIPLVVNDEGVTTIYGVDALPADEDGTSDYQKAYISYNVDGEVVMTGTWEYDEDRNPVFTPDPDFDASDEASAVQAQMVDEHDDGDDEGDDILDFLFV